MDSYAPYRPSGKKWWVREKDHSNDYRNIAKNPTKRFYGGWRDTSAQIEHIINQRAHNKERVYMLLTKYKIQEMIEKTELDINDVMHGLERHDEGQEWDNSHAFVAGYVEQLVKDAIIDQLGRM